MASVSTGGSCAVALAYQGRYNTFRPRFVSGDCLAEAEAALFDPGRIGVARTFACRVDGIEAGPARGASGVDSEATPGCTRACTAGGLVLGDIDDPDAEAMLVSATTSHIRRHARLGTGPGVHDLWE